MSKGRELVAMLPRNRVLTETDGPFATHEDRTVVPSDVSDTIMLLASSWDIEVSQAEGQVRANLQALLAS
ncbi:TatD family hydrolase [Nostocoides sp.]|uniref:TatD family hydrolase n=1 Tax=Nostocoides sp. TaxID=1917966 RepID=UPI003BAE4617